MKTALILALCVSGAAQAQVDWLQRTDQNFNSSMEVIAFAKAGGNVNGEFESGY